MVLLYENTKLIGTADNERIGIKMIKDQFADCSQRGYFSNQEIKGLYKDPCGALYQGIPGTVYEFESTCDDDPVYRVVPVSTNQFLPGCEKLPTTAFNP